MNSNMKTAGTGLFYGSYGEYPNLQNPPQPPPPLQGSPHLLNKYSNILPLPLHQQHQQQQQQQVQLPQQQQPQSQHHSPQSYPPAGIPLTGANVGSANASSGFVMNQLLGNPSINEKSQFNNHLQHQHPPHHHPQHNLLLTPSSIMTPADSVAATMSAASKQDRTTGSGPNDFLNKYDFHKIRANSGDTSSLYGDNAWEFKHPDFQLHNKDQIDNIKRKTTSSRKHAASNGVNNSAGASANALTNDGTFPDNHGEFASMQYVARLEHELNDSRAAQEALHKELAALRDVHSTTLHRLNTLQQDHKVTDDVLRQLLMLLQSAQFRNPMESPTASNTYSQLLNLLTTLNTTEATRNDIPVSVAPRANVLPPLAGAKPSPNYTTASLGKSANSAYLVLLVEDDELSVRVCRRFLAQYGCQVDVANDGVSAVKRAQAGSYDIILMETVMPQLDGLSATDLIRKFDPGTPIVAMTSNMSDDTDDVAKYYRHGITDILPKPFSKDELTQLLDLYLKRDNTNTGNHNGAMGPGSEGDGDDDDKRPLLPPPSSAFQNDSQPPGEQIGGYKRSDDEVMYGSIKKPRLM
ncbi:hypothetical protein DV495_004864 [Geotrichum candidum]|nr:hypothetical protein DV495_004864 [Geotrichum candidum]